MESINIRIDRGRLTHLIRQGELCVSQLQALDPQSKQALWQLCLECSCEHNNAVTSTTTNTAKPLRFRHYQRGHSTLGHDS